MSPFVVGTGTTLTDPVPCEWVILLEGGVYFESLLLLQQ